MRTLNAKSFWTYAGIAAVLTLLSHLLVSQPWLKPSRIYPDPSYQAHSAAKAARERWERDNRGRIDMRTFEEIVAGQKPVDAAPAGAAREFVASVRALANGAANDPIAWSRALTGTFFSPEGKPRAIAWIRCSHVDGDERKAINACWFVGWADVLNDPERLAKVLAKDPAAFTVVASEAPDVPRFSGTRLTARPSWYLPLVWATVTSLFGIFFCLVGMITRWLAEDSRSYRPQSADDKGWGHPFRSWPNFVLGWIVMLAALPGFLLTRLSYLLVIDATPAAAKIMSLMVRKPSFADEYEEFAAQLNAMRSAAAGHPDVLKQIEYLGAQIQGAQDAKKLARLKDSLSHMQSYLELTADIGG